ncbi:DUF5336 domain-containing protein [Mycobacterium sp. 1274756.6]|uniref:DUF5336 domain-containing protein n=1 Tax=Mycobacterium sp. 1274756.6 TaxID=1834076 RepID=UPI0008013C6C|nr:DUF5336 domain-containing protein [Mycobacterium sp. 1274756.6]OBJ67979.1 hypothetical protein A5643_16000 [Mycobacterium sp. 1274756.6]
MTYPPGNPGYPPAQPPGGYGSPAPASPAAGFTTPGSGESKLPLILGAAVAVLGLLTYLASFGPMLEIEGPYSGVSSTSGASLEIMIALAAGLLAAVALIPKAKNYSPIVAVLAVVGLLGVISDVLTKSDGMTVGWGLWLALVLTLLQAGAAVAAVLLDAGVISAPAPRPNYGQYAPYGQYGPAAGGYYGQPGQPGQPGQHGQPGGFGQAPQQPAQPGLADQHTVLHSSYPSQSGGYGASSQPGQHQGASTPPTGFPGYSSPSGSGTSGTGPDNGGSSEGSSSGSGPTPS